jgi:hypothetical protein
MCTREEAVVPAAAGIELADEIEQPRGRGVEMRAELGDLVADSIELDDVRMSRDEAGTTEVHRRASSCCADSNPGFPRPLRGVRTRDRRAIPIFSSEA